MKKTESNHGRSAEGEFFTIGDLAKRTTQRCGLRCTPVMIYNYERLGLMDPPRKTDGGTRLYTESDMARLVLIKRLQRELGASLSATKAALSVVKEASEIRQDNEKLQQFILQHKLGGKVGSGRFLGSSQTRKQAMTSAALDLFEKKGYHRTTIADITSAAGTSHGTFYVYFKDKHALIEEIVDTVMEATSRAVEEADPKRGGARERILAMAQSFFQLDKRYQRMAHIFVQGAARDKDAYDKRVERVYARISAPFVDVIQEGIVDRTFRCEDAKRAAFEIISVVELFRYRSIFEDRFVFGRFGPDLEGFDAGRQMELMWDLIDGILRPVPAFGTPVGTRRQGKEAADPGPGPERDGPRMGNREKREASPNDRPLPVKNPLEGRNDPLRHCRGCEFFETCEKFCGQYFA